MWRLAHAAAGMECREDWSMTGSTRDGVFAQHVLHRLDLMQAKVATAGTKRNAQQRSLVKTDLSDLPSDACERGALLNEICTLAPIEKLKLRAGLKRKIKDCAFACDDLGGENWGQRSLNLGGELHAA